MMSFAVVVVAKATVVCGAAILFARRRRIRASIRHFVILLTFVGLVVIPVAGPAIPSIAVVLPSVASSAFERPQESPRPAAVTPAEDSRNVDGLAVSRFTTTDRARSLDAIRVVSTIWLAGVAFCLIPVLVGFWQVQRLRARALPWSDGEELVQRLAAAIGLRRRVEAVIHETVAGPMTCGVLRPSILLPANAREWDETTLRRAVRHELEHVARWDVLTNCLSRIVCAAYWFHPLVWMAWRQLRLEAERACDDAVVLNDDATDYAALLVAMARCDHAGTRRPLLAMAGRDDLAARVTALLDRRQTRGRVGCRRLATLTVAGAIAIASVTSLSIVRAMPQSQATNAAAQLPTTPTGSIKRNPPIGIRQVDGRTVATGVTVRTLLIAAFAVRDVENAPYWVHADRFDIVFDGAYKFGPTQESTAVQTFLTERFKLAAHRAEKDFPVYALVQAQPNPRGTQLRPSQSDCSDRADCGLSSSDGQLTGRGVTMAELVRVLPLHLGSVPGGRQIFDRELLDRTGLNGRFDFRMEWEPDAAANAAAGSGLESKAPRFLAALQQQLGLTIESQTAPAPVLVIDSIEPPTEN